jgi:hypothetical protein
MDGLELGLSPQLRERRVLLLVRQPLCCKSRPLQCRAEDHVVKERSVLFPCFVFWSMRVSLDFG